MTHSDDRGDRKLEPSSDGEWWRASFSIFSVALTHQEISERIGLQPTRTRAKGDPRGARRMDGSVITSIVWHDSAWHLVCPLKSDKSLDQHIRWLLDTIEPRLPAINAISNECTLIRFFCGFSSEHGQGGFTLDAETLRRISKVGVKLDLDLYPPGHDEEPSENEPTSDAKCV
jgi:uncharacterized protein DUF4279